jgi:hypothetical protein
MLRDVGMLEYWNIGRMGRGFQPSIIPIFHYSTIFLLFAEVM